MLCMAARTGRNLQRYSNQDHRLVVGCIPYRYKMNGSSDEAELQVLVISSKKSEAMMFPKGGWESDESVEEAASRESLEEAGVLGKVECELGRWIFKSKSREVYRQGLMFPLLVTQQLDLWPDQNARNRQWVSVSEAREACQQWWMKEALDILYDITHGEGFAEVQQPRSTTRRRGGWEIDESAKEAASRESLEEAGVRGKVEGELGRWIFKSKSREVYHQGLMFPLLVSEQLENWPEKTERNRQWVSVGEAKEACQQWWMKEALDKLVDRLKNQ